MPRVPEIELSKAALECELRQLCAESESLPKLIPSLRELADRHAISKSLAQRVVRSLCEEGLLFPVHGMGTFAGRKPTLSDNVYLFVGEEGFRDGLIRHGFEQRLSVLGAQSIAMPIKEATRQWNHGQLPEVQGVWNPTFDLQKGSGAGPVWQAPVVGLGGHVDPTSQDAVVFDDFRGGKAATLHLLTYGMRTGLFLGVHASDAPIGAVDWSRGRAEGFLAAMNSVGLEKSAQIVVPGRIIVRKSRSEPFDWFEMGRQMATDYLATAKGLSDELGVVAVNDMVAYGFLSVLVQSGISPGAIPPIIGFDNINCRVGSHLSSMDLPWHELGRVAADILFRRSRGELPPAPVSEEIPMTQITRFSSTRGWLVRSPALYGLLLKSASEADFT